VQLLWLAVQQPLLSLLQHGAGGPGYEPLRAALPSALQSSALSLRFFTGAAAALAAAQQQRQQLLVLCEVACGREQVVAPGAFFSEPKLGRTCTRITGAGPEASGDAPWPCAAEGAEAASAEEGLEEEDLPPQCIAHYGSCPREAASFEQIIVVDPSQVRLRYVVQLAQQE